MSSPELEGKIARRSRSTTAPLIVIDRAKRHGWTMKAIAAAAGIERGQIVRMSKGQSVQPEALDALARFAPQASAPPPG